MKVVFLLLAFASDNNLPEMIEGVALNLFAGVFSELEDCKDAKGEIEGVARRAGAELEYTCYPVVEVTDKK